MKKTKMILIALCILLVAALTIPTALAFAENVFTPSVSQKGIRMGGFRNPADGLDYPGIIVDEEGNTLSYLECFRLVPVADALDEATTEHEKEMLQWGFDNLLNADLNFEVDGLQEALEAMDAPYTPDDLLCYELFHITLCEKCTALLSEGNRMMIKLEQNNKDVDFEIAIHVVDGSVEYLADEDEASFVWNTLAPEYLSKDEDGSHIISIEEGCLYALLTNVKD